MKNKKGFTLVELLAVIVILAVIALIATPQVLGMIESARKGAAESSTLSYVDSVEKAIVSKTIMSSKDTNYDGKYTLIGNKLSKNDASLELDLKGDKPDSNASNEVTVEKGIVKEAYLKFGEYYVTYKNSNNEISYCSSKEGYLNNCSDKEIKDLTYKESILNGADPVVEGDLLPVKINNDGKVIYADPTEEWYKYADKKWANAVILKDKTKTYKYGEEIPKSNIESYMVWIPRYRYKIFNLGNYDSITNVDNSINKTIEIVFEDKYTKASTGTTVGSYLTHPAFTTFNTNGIWVGKFETTGTSSSITVKPSETSLRNLNIKTMFNLAYNYNRNLNSHMMKNTEWGSVTYLTYSKYGKNSKVRINNNSDYKTGYASVKEPTCGWTNSNETCNKYGTDSSVTIAYNTTTGYLASTTGNITGIYDMSGGAHEYMASYMSGQVGESGFTLSEINSKVKYFDVYSSTSSIYSYNNRILGDATGELGPFGEFTSTGSDGVKKTYVTSFYSGVSRFVASQYPWVYRGSYYGTGVLAGPSYFDRFTGSAHDGSVSFRLVLAN